MGTDLFSRSCNFIGSAINPKQYFQTNPMTSTSVVLMIVLFSFGILFTNWITPPTPFPVTNIGEPLPPVLTPRIFDDDRFECLSNTKNPITVLTEQSIPTARLTRSLDSIVFTRPAIEDKSQFNLMSTPESVIESSKSLELSREEDSLSTAIVQPSIQPEFYSMISDTPILKPEPCSQQDNIPLPYTQQDDSPLPCSQQDNSPLLNDTLLRPQISVWRSNTTYLLCGNVAQIHPEPGVLFEDYPDDRDSMMINILIPPDKSNTEKTFLSVTCKVLETSYIPAEKMMSRISLTLSYM